MKTLYAVSSGSYSDYSVLCVLETKEGAEKLAARIRENEDGFRDDAFVEELMLVTPGVQQIDVLRMNVVLMDDGSEANATIHHAIEWPFDPLWEVSEVQWRWIRAPMYNNQAGRLEVSGTNHERVRKVFSDKKAQIKADETFRVRIEMRGRQ